jgi:hypothetical protein
MAGGMAGHGMRGALSAAAAGLLLSNPVHAQDTDQQQMMAMDGALPRNAESVKAVYSYGACAARDAGFQSKLVLRGFPGSAASDKPLFWIATGSNSCGKTEEASKFSPRALRGPIAEYYLKRDFDLESWKPKGRLLTLYDAPDSGKLASLPADVRANVVLVEIGSCAAQRNPAGMAALFRSAVASSEEAEAFRTLSSSLAACLPPSVELKMSKFQLRSYFAEGAYRAAAAAAKAKQ